MDYVRLGATGIKVSRLCLGTLPFGKKGWRGWALGEEESRPIIRRAFELGINFFDTANYYSDGASEEVLGRSLKDIAKRDELVIATKVYRPMGSGPNDRGLSRKHVMSSIDASLRRLGTDYIDLMQIHRWDYETPIEETLSTLNDAVRAGKVRYIGACTMYAWQFTKALYLADRHGWERFVSMQCQHNLLYRENEREVLPLCEAEGIGVIAYSPLARGLLTGGRKRMEDKATQRLQHDTLNDAYFSPDELDIAERVVELAARRGETAPRIALAWVLRQPEVSAAIIGSTRADHLDDLVKALPVKLDDDEAKFLSELYKPKREVMI
jgi:aryl-alcohol dehydrogenase-like predicted oxidoreductase